MSMKAKACPRCLNLMGTGDPEDGSIHTCSPTEFVRGLEARIRDLEAAVAADDLASHVIEYRARISELEAVVAADGREIYDLLEREKHTQETYVETGQKIIDQHNQIQELLALVRLLKRDAADGTENQHFKDGAEAALRWAFREARTDYWNGQEWLENERIEYIQRGLKAVCGDS